MVEENNGLPKEGSDGLGVSRVLARGSASRGHGKGRARAFVLALILHFSSLYSMNPRCEGICSGLHQLRVFRCDATPSLTRCLYLALRMPNLS